MLVLIIELYVIYDRRVTVQFNRPRVDFVFDRLVSKPFKDRPQHPQTNPNPNPADPNVTLPATLQRHSPNPERVSKI